MVKKCKQGFKRKEGKCVKQKSKSFFNIKKKYNPFKMWGSYVGAILGLILGNLLIATIFIFKEGNLSLELFIGFLNPINSLLTVGVINPFSLGIFTFLILLIIGFLIGLGIHVWIKKRRR